MVAADRKHFQVGFAAVVDEAAHVAKVTRIHVGDDVISEQVLPHRDEVVHHVTFVDAISRLLIGQHLSRVLAHKLAFFYRGARIDLQAFEGVEVDD